MVDAVETMAYAGEVPWHGSGNQVDDGVSVDEMTTQAGLNWTVSKRPVLYNTPENTVQMTFKDRFVLARDTDGKAMSVVSSRYKPVQPKEVMGFFRDLVDLGGFKLETAGSLQDGKKIWALARTGDTANLLGVDRVDEFLLLATSYDGTFATVAEFTDIRVVCLNTLAAALGNWSTRISIPHLREFNADEIKERMGIHKDAWEARRQAMELLARTKVDVAKASNVIHAVFKAPLGEITSKEQAVLKNHATNVLQLFSGTGMGSDLSTAANTAWGLVNAGTEYVDHWKRARTTDSRMNNAWFGEGARLKQDFWNAAMELAA